MFQSKPEHGELIIIRVNYCWGDDRAVALTGFYFETKTELWTDEKFEESDKERVFGEEYVLAGFYEYSFTNDKFYKIPKKFIKSWEYIDRDDTPTFDHPAYYKQFKFLTKRIKKEEK